MTKLLKRPDSDRISRTNSIIATAAATLIGNYLREHGLELDPEALASVIERLVALAVAYFIRNAK